MSMRVFTIRIPDSDYERLKEMARRSDRTLSDAVRVLLRHCEIETVIHTARADRVKHDA
jgi:predicted DNA-binding protein